MEFERTRRKKAAALPLTPMIDIMFILIVFFMLTTSFMRVESLELNLPSAAGKTAEKSDVKRLFIQANGDMMLDQQRLGQNELDTLLKRLFEKDASTRVMLLTAEGVTMQQLVGIMDRVYVAGGKSLFVRKWNTPATVGASPDAPIPASDANGREPAKPVVLQ